MEVGCGGEDGVIVTPLLLLLFEALDVGRGGHETIYKGRGSTRSGRRGGCGINRCIRSGGCRGGSGPIPTTTGVSTLRVGGRAILGTAEAARGQAQKNVWHTSSRRRRGILSGYLSMPKGEKKHV